MKAFRIKLTSWTSSFRYPNIISGFQPTLEVPPISTVLGLLNACAGKYLFHRNLQIGYCFQFGGKDVDLETIYQFAVDDNGAPKNEVKSNVIKREFLNDCTLYIYLVDHDLVDFFKRPYFPILLGRSNDLATIVSIDEVELKEISNASKIKGQVIPFAGNYLPGTIQAIPKYFTDEIPRRTIGTEAYSIIPFGSMDYPTRITAYRDNVDNNEVDIYFHNISM